MNVRGKLIMIWSSLIAINRYAEVSDVFRAKHHRARNCYWSLERSSVCDALEPPASPRKELCQLSVLRVHSVVAVQLWRFFVVIEVPPDLAVDCWRRATQTVGDLFNWYVRLKQFGQFAAFFEAPARVAVSHWSTPHQVLFWYRIRSSFVNSPPNVFRSAATSRWRNHRDEWRCEALLPRSGKI